MTETKKSQNGISHALLEAILMQYKLSWRGIHGLSHWARVLLNGRRLSRISGANLNVVELFAVFHDSRRENDGYDFGHGRRGAELAASLRGTLVHLDGADFDLLYHACACHTEGLTEGDVTIQTCWDSDRLDLWRVHITPEVKYLCTSAAMDAEVYKQAEVQSRFHEVPHLIYKEWGIVY